MMPAKSDVNLTRLGTLGGALGDPTRFSVYTHVVASPEPLSAGEVAEVFGLHRTVARSHLEKLRAAGLMTVGTRRKATGGRPAKVYSAAADRLEIQIPPRRYESLSIMLVGLARKLNGQARDLALAVGADHGRELAGMLPREVRGGRSLPAIESVMQVLNERGCQPQIIELTPERIVLEVSNCLFLEVADEAPQIVCGLSTGLLCGILGAETQNHRQTASILAGDRACRHEFAF
jgi:predicted ArsR family transcriptional regulator